MSEVRRRNTLAFPTVQIQYIRFPPQILLVKLYYRYCKYKTGRCMPTIDIPCIHLGLHNAGPLCIQNIKVKDMNILRILTFKFVATILSKWTSTRYTLHWPGILMFNSWVIVLYTYMRGRLPACVDSITCICGKDDLQYMCGQSNMCQWDYPNVWTGFPTSVNRINNIGDHDYPHVLAGLRLYWLSYMCGHIWRHVWQDCLLYICGQDCLHVFKGLQTGVSRTTCMHGQDYLHVLTGLPTFEDRDGYISGQD